MIEEATQCLHTYVYTHEYTHMHIPHTHKEKNDLVYFNMHKGGGNSI